MAVDRYNKEYDPDTILSAAARDTLRHLEIVARRTVEGMLHGAHKSKRKGVSTEFDHHKLYQPGDSLKHIDWKVSARQDKYYIKRYLEDTSLTVRIVVDASGSMDQKTGDSHVYLQAARMAASLSYLIVNQQDRVGMGLACSDSQKWFPVKSTEQHLVQLFTALAETKPKGEGNLEIALKSLLERGGYKGLVVVVSDLMFDPEPVQRQLACLQAQGHEVLVCQVVDETIKTFPFNRWAVFQDLELASRKHRLDAVPLKKIYLEEFEKLQESWRVWSSKQDAHFVSFSSDDAIEQVLGEYITYREETLGKH